MIQISCVMVLWIVKSFKIISPIFPLVVLLMIPLRVLLGKVFSANEMEQVCCFLTYLSSLSTDWFFNISL